MGPNGIGKSTLLKVFMGELAPDAGTVEWGYGTAPGYFAQDHHEKLEQSDRTAESWLWDYCSGRDRGYVRGALGLMLFTGDDSDKPLSALSGGEAARLVFSRLSIEQPNVLVLDEPTNHLDLESIEALVAGLQNYEGTLVLVSHDRWFVGQLATRVVEIQKDGIRDYPGTYEEYVHACGDDHLDADTVVLKAKRDEKKSKRSGDNGAAARTSSAKGREHASHDHAARRAREDRLTVITQEIEGAEGRIADIDATFATPGYFDSAAADDVQALQTERASLVTRTEGLMTEWERLEKELQAAVS
jgi:ABC-type multidrug transport system ATPase subunit